MAKLFIKLILFITIVFSGVIIFLTSVGYETGKFDSLIKEKVNNLNKNVQLEFKKTKIFLDPIELNLVAKLQNTKVLIRGNAIDLSNFDLYLSLKALFTSSFLLEKAEIGFFENNIKDLTKVTNIIIPKFVNKKLNKRLIKGTLQGKFTVPFDSNGGITKDYGFVGKISEATIKITKNFFIKNLTTEISYGKEVSNRGLETKVIKGLFLDLNLDGSIINIKKNNNVTKIVSSLSTKGDLNFKQVKNLISLFNLRSLALKETKGTVDLKTDVSFDITKSFKIKNFIYSSKGKIDSLDLTTHQSSLIKKYLPNYNNKLIFKDNRIKLEKKKSLQNLQINGLVKTDQNFDAFKITKKYFYKKNLFIVNGDLDLTNTEVNFAQINYLKSDGKTAELKFDLDFIPNKFLYIKKFKLNENKSKIDLTNIKLNKNFEAINFEKVEIKTFLNKNKNNDYVIKKEKNIEVSGDIFDAEPLLKSLFKNNNKKTFDKKFKSKLRINFKKILSGTTDNIHNVSMIASINQGSYSNLNLKGNFTENELFEMSIYKIDDNKKTLQVISDRARPFIEHFDFIKGFEDGKLEYESIISKEGTSSNLLITDFKVSEVPALAKLLTLASLRGIADTLSGEGIRFESFEMKSNSIGNIMNIEDALAIGPAVSILLEGYVDKGKTVSLRGTLVPATKLNELIALIPVVGDILVGKKTGEGVVGVSFKLKGPPKDIKTTVNPIKTLTPRFIVRAVEKMKKKKREEAK